MNQLFGRNRLRPYILLLCTLPASAQDAKTLSRAVALLKSVPPHATLAQLKKFLPPGAKLGLTQSTTQGPGKSWVVVPFRGTLSGQFVFFNTRRASIRKPGMPPPPPFDSINKMLLPRDSVHYVEIFVGAPLKSSKKGALTAETKRFVDALTKKLGKPAHRENTGEDGGPDATGWMADWKFSGGRQIGFLHSFALLSSDERPILTLDWSYSQIYRD